MSVPAPGNPLVAERVDSTTAITGIGVVESAMGLYEGVESGSWVEGGLGAAGAGLETLGLVLDPVGTLVSYGVAWLMEHVQPLSDALDWLAGDPDTIASYAVTWRNVAAAVQQAGADFGAAVGEGTAGWQGQAAEGYRAHTARQVEQLTAAGTGAQTVGSVVEGAGVLVGVVREVVRDLVAECVSTLIARIPQWLAEIGLTVGIATPHVVASAVALIARWVDRISEVIIKLTRSLGNLMPLIRRLEELFAGIREGLTRAGRAVPSSPGGPASSPTGPVASPNSPELSAYAAPSAPSAGPPPSTSPITVTPTVDSTASAPGATTPQSSSVAGAGDSPGSPAQQSSSPALPPISAANVDVQTPATGGGRSSTTLPPRHSRTSDTEIARRQPELREQLGEPRPDSDWLGGEPAPYESFDGARPGDLAHDRVTGVHQQPTGQELKDFNGRWSAGRDPATGFENYRYPSAPDHPNGFSTSADREAMWLEPGLRLDRFGGEGGSFLSPEGEAWSSRALPPYTLNSPYHVYEVAHSFPAWVGDSAPWFDRPGGGSQVYTGEVTIEDLLRHGYIREVQP